MSRSRETRYELESYERKLNALQYAGVFQRSAQDRGIATPNYKLPDNSLTLRAAALLLTENALGPPHGLDMLIPRPLPDVPKVPSDTSSAKGQLLAHCARELRQRFQDQYTADAERLDALRRDCLANEPAGIQAMMNLTHVRHWLPQPLSLAFNVDVDVPSRIGLCTIEIPDFAHVPIVKLRGKSWQPNWVSVSVTEKKRCSETILYSLCLRAAYLVACSDAGDWFDTVALNANQHWFDAATGAPREGIIASLQAPKEEIRQLRLDQVDPKICFRHLKGIATSSLQSVAPVRPIFVLNKNDRRIIEQRNVADALEEEANLAAMPWDDFEHLVRQLFEWEFGRNGVEVKVTRASRDRGVDAIMFDPDPLRGGKYVLQAKRYTRPVDVAAVRDLYGTVVNEGANRGILVTTSSYDPDSYEFAKDKPISLVDGPNLLAMLTKHGRRYRIDLAEARRIDARP
jgi:restriction system protein